MVGGENGLLADAGDVLLLGLFLGVIIAVREMGKIS